MSHIVGANSGTNLEVTIPAHTGTATVRPFPGGWHSVSYGDHTVSVAPDGLIHLARHLKPEQATDFVGALLAASAVAAKVVAGHGGGPVGPGLRNSAGEAIAVPTVPRTPIQPPLEVFAPESRKALERAPEAEPTKPSPEVLARAKRIAQQRRNQPSRYPATGPALPPHDPS